MAARLHSSQAAEEGRLDLLFGLPAFDAVLALDFLLDVEGEVVLAVVALLAARHLDEGQDHRVFDQIFVDIERKIVQSGSHLAPVHYATTLP